MYYAYGHPSRDQPQPIRERRGRTPAARDAHDVSADRKSIRQSDRSSSSGRIRARKVLRNGGSARGPRFAIGRCMTHPHLALSARGLLIALSTFTIYACAAPTDETTTRSRADAYVV